MHSDKYKFDTYSYCDTITVDAVNCSSNYLSYLQIIACINLFECINCLNNHITRPYTPTHKRWSTRELKDALPIQL